MKLLAIIAISLSLVPTPTIGHPGEQHDKFELLREMTARGLIASKQRDALSGCQDSVESRAVKERALQRRAATAQRLREQRRLSDEPFLQRRTLAQFENWENTAHDQSSSLQYNSSTPESALFGTKTTCILTPDNANGPYFVLGEQIRSNVAETQPGIPLHLEMQFVDVTTCKPAMSLLVDIWSCNATGHYSGVSTAGESSLNATFLRGVQATDSDGVVAFDTIFPGHYSGRATHEHVISHTGATINPNGTYSGGHVSHLSQLFFDQVLINAVEATSPYSSNAIARTSNNADLYTGYSATAAYDPFPDYIILGNQLSHGIFAWIEIGINTTNNWHTYATNAACLATDGGHDNPSFNIGIVGTPPPDAG